MFHNVIGCPYFAGWEDPQWGQTITGSRTSSGFLEGLPMNSIVWSVRRARTAEKWVFQGHNLSTALCDHF